MGVRKPKDRDFLLTVDGLLFCVVGYLHPPDRLTAYVKYAPLTSSPSPSGRGGTGVRVWRRGEVTYDRVLARYSLDSVRDTLRFLQENYPHYIHHCPVRDMVFSMVPLDRVAEYYVPEVRLAEIMAAPRDPLEEEAAALAAQLAQATGIPVTALGVTGSLLPGIHNPAFSDIDLTVYGSADAWRVCHFLRELKAVEGSRLKVEGSQMLNLSTLRAEPQGEAFNLQPSTLNLPTLRAEPQGEACNLQIRPHTPEEVAARREGILTIHPTLAPAVAQYLAERRWNFLRFGDRYFSIHATRTDAEITETYGDYVYRDRGTARIVAQVVDVSEALFSPAIYRVNQVQVLNGEAADVREVVSFDRIFADAVDPGAKIEVWGRVEQVVVRGGTYDRLVIGTAALPDGGYLIPLSPIAPSLPGRERDGNDCILIP
jgi:predicted nucleotidyltransferase